jgi:hypothetical protein
MLYLLEGARRFFLFAESIYDPVGKDVANKAHIETKER